MSAEPKQAAAGLAVRKAVLFKNGLGNLLRLFRLPPNGVVARSDGEQVRRAAPSRPRSSSLVHKSPQRKAVVR